MNIHWKDMLKLKLQDFGHLMKRPDSLEKTLMLADAEGKRRRGWQRLRWLESNTNSMDMNLNKLDFFKRQFICMLFLFSCPVLSDCLQPHELQHTPPPCPLPSFAYLTQMCVCVFVCVCPQSCLTLQFHGL